MAQRPILGIAIAPKTCLTLLGQDLDYLWDTQVNFGGVFPDMVAKLPNEVMLVFEHKVWANLHPGQLDNYKQFSYENYSSFHLILITASESQHL
ncbi:MAG: hypothetical protein ACHWZW_19370 [Spirulina sp.]